MSCPPDIASRIEHTLLKPEATPDDIDRLCDEAARWGLFAVCVNPLHVARAARRLENAATIVVSVAGFPLGATHTATKVDEARRAIDDGAREIDMVARIGDLRAGDRAAVRDDIYAVACAVHASSPHHRLKVILETAALTEEQIILGCRCAAEGEADFVKTSTGFHPAGGATLEAVRLLHRHAAPIGVKAAGGIRTLHQARAMIDAGAARIGTSSGVAIVREAMETPA